MTWQSVGLLMSGFYLPVLIFAAVIVVRQAAKIGHLTGEVERLQARLKHRPTASRNNDPADPIHQGR